MNATSAKQNRQDVPDGDFWHKMVHTITSGDEAIILGFEWHGGAYIDVCRVMESPSGAPGKWLGAREVINVWDYQDDGPTIPRTKGAMARRVDDWIVEYGEDGGTLFHDVTTHWR